MLTKATTVLEPLRRNPIALEKLASGPLLQLAVQGDRLAVVVGERLLVLSGLDGKTPAVVFSRDLAWPLARVALSSSLRYLLLVSATRSELEMWDLAKDRVAAHVTAPPGERQMYASAIVSSSDQDVLLVSRERMVLEGYFLPDMQRRLRADCTSPVAFVFTGLVPMRDADTVVALGYHFSEGKDSLLTLSLRAMLQDAQAAAREAVERKRVNDYAYRLAAGVCGIDAVVIFRDPEEDESPDEKEDAAGNTDIWSVRGLYARRLADNKLLERIDYDAPIETGAPIFATDTVVVVGCPDRVEIIPRGGSEGEVESIPTRAHAFDSEGGRIALVTKEGELQLLQLPGMPRHT